MVNNPEVVGYISGVVFGVTKKITYSLTRRFQDWHCGFVSSMARGLSYYSMDL